MLQGCKGPVGSPELGSSGGIGWKQEDSEMLTLLTWIQARLDNEDGATMVEYGIMVAVIALVAVVGASALGIGIDTLFGNAETELGLTTP
jgi:pilus assembly protein Flp/PilA